MKINNKSYLLAALVVFVIAIAVAWMFGDFVDESSHDKCPECVCPEKYPEHNFTCPECVCPKQECPKVECPKAEYPKIECPKPAGNVTIITKVRNLGNANFDVGKVKFIAGSNMQTSVVNSSFTWNSSQSDKISVFFDLNYSCPECPKCESEDCSCSCPTCPICPECHEQERPDLSVVNISLNPETINAGDTLNINAIIKNLKNVSAGYVRVLFEIDNFTKQVFVYLSANSTENVSFEWIANEGNYTLTIKADDNDMINETNETNNEYSFNVTVLPTVCNPYNFREVWNSNDIIDGFVDGIAIGDLNSNGKDEIVAVTTNYYIPSSQKGWYGKNSIYIFEENRSNSYVKQWSGDICGGRDVTISDVNNDNKPEIIIGNSKHLASFKDYSGDDYLVVLEKNNNSVSWNISWNISIPVDKVLAGDVDGDTLNEIVAIGNKGIYVFKFNGSGYYMVWQNSSIASTIMDIGDVDNDGINEIVVEGKGIYIFKWDKDKNNYSIYWMNATISTKDVDITDINNDSKNEIIATSNNILYIIKCNNSSCNVIAESTYNIPSWCKRQIDINIGAINDKVVILHGCVSCIGSVFCTGSFLSVYDFNNNSILNVWEKPHIEEFMAGIYFNENITQYIDEKTSTILFGVHGKGTIAGSLKIFKRKCKKGDYNCDCKINSYDFVEFARAYGKDFAPSWADFNDDGKIDKIDLQEFIKKIE